MTRVQASHLRGFAVRTSDDRPNMAVLEMQIEGAIGYYLVPKNQLRKLAQHLASTADRMDEELQ